MPNQEGWDQYIERLEHYFSANGITDSGKQRAILLTIIGVMAYSLLHNLVSPAKPGDKTFAELCKLMQKHYNLAPSVIVQRCKFNGHLGMKKTRAKVWMRFYWVGIRAVVRKCSVCAQRKTPSNRKNAPLQQEAVGAPMERGGPGYCRPSARNGMGNKYILVVGDYFSEWMEAYPIPDQTAETVAEKFVSKFVCRFGVPKVLHSDQGRNFESKVFKEMSWPRQSKNHPIQPKVGWADREIQPHPDHHRVNADRPSQSSMGLGPEGTPGPFCLHVVSPRVHWRDPQHVDVGQGALVAD